MKVILAKKAGFCMGVRRAVETTLETVHKEDGKIVTFGPLIHNPQVLGLLKEQGVDILNEIPEKLSGTVIIRAHGVPPSQKQRLVSAGANVKDATCPRVMKVQAIIKKFKDQDYTTIIIGDKNHAEVVGLMGYAEPNVCVVSNENDVDTLHITGPYIIVSQTTQDEMAFKRLSNLIVERFPDGKVFNTICDSTHKRQEEVRNLCRKVQALVVVGGSSSANTQRLGKIAEEMGCQVFMAETQEDLDFEVIAKFDCVGVTAGASTPTWMINRIVRALESCPGKADGIFTILFFKFLRSMMASNFFVSLAGGLLALICSILQEFPPDTRDFFVAFGYLFAIHNMNRYADYKTKKLNDPLQESFWHSYSIPLIVLSGLALSLSMFSALQQGMLQFGLLLVMSVLGILYNVPIIPKVITGIIKVRKLKEIPGSKTFFVALAWSFVTVLIPALKRNASSSETISVFLLIALFVFIRTVLFDVFDVQGDMIAGKETLPVCIGERKSIRLLYFSMTILAILLILFTAMGTMAKSGILVLLPISSLLLLTRLYEKKKLVQGIRLEFWLESHFYMIAAFVWLGSMLFH
ncbi:MAG: 4-hydroxy-3-methylbut-2-enyl diphosphate reductase [Deltaproteobacteria bacterium]|nr:4-hydroxy-3-methylbut-2-enyl diphosphate reductase [Deltaproteobacteria bacterium]